MIAVIAVVIIAVAGGATAVYLTSNHGSKEDPLAYFDGAGLKVLGNENKDNVIDSKDYDAVQALVNDKASAKDHPLADANNDGTLDEKDLDYYDYQEMSESSASGKGIEDGGYGYIDEENDYTSDDEEEFSISRFELENDELLSILEQDGIIGLDEFSDSEN